MAHWFHRNPLKATSAVTYELRAVASNAQSQKICTELRHGRTRLMEIIANPNNDVSTLVQASDNYLSLLYGFMQSLDAARSGDSKLRHIINFRWTNTLQGTTPEECQDAVFELACIMVNIGLWYSKHASKLAGQDEPSMDEAKEIHKCLRTAAGVFTYVKENLVGKLMETPGKGTDLDARVLAAYIHQCTAEAQEVTIARAMELKHKSSIVSALAYETTKLFTDADDSLNSLDEKQVSKWRKYLQFKIQIYKAYAYNFHGESMLAEDKCGEAIKCLEESLKALEQAAVQGKEYALTKGPGTTARPQEHLFFRKLGPVVKRTHEKCVRENGFIYHQKVPPEAPALELKATYGLVAPEEFKVPEMSPLWSPETYAAFAIDKNLPEDPNDKDKKKKEEGDIAPVKEADIPQSNKDPNNSSGCIIS